MHFQRLKGEQEIVREEKITGQGGQLKTSVL